MLSGLRLLLPQNGQHYERQSAASVWLVSYIEPLRVDVRRAIRRLISHEVVALIDDSTRGAVPRTWRSRHLRTGRSTRLYVIPAKIIVTNA